MNKPRNWLKLFIVCSVLNILFISGIFLTLYPVNQEEIILKEPGELITQTTSSDKVPSVIVNVVYTTSNQGGTTDAELTPKTEYLVSDRNSWKLYKNVVGELSIPSLNYKQLIVQASDNEYYLDKDINGKYLQSGSVFGDYRNNFEMLDANNILYGHNMADGSKFGILPKLRITASELQGNDLNIYFNSEGFCNVFRICSIYEIDLTSFNYIQTYFENDTAKAEFLQMILNLNECAEIDTQIPLNTKILTLSTCTQDGTHRLVVHGYLTNRTNAI